MMGRAHGKLILFGEHFVVHGEPAVVTGIDQTLVVSVRRSADICLWPDGWNNEKAMEAVKVALSYARYSTGAKVKVFSDFPPGAGLGASGAFSVAVARALRIENVLDVAHEMEKSFHGKPSGIDTAAAYYGRTLLFKNRQEIRTLPEIGAWIVAVYSGDREKSVKELVENVWKLKNEKPDWFYGVLLSYRRLLERALQSMEEGDLYALGKLMDENQALLKKIGVSSPKIERAISFLREKGAVGAKLTGGGSGGFVIGLFDSKRDAKGVMREGSKTFRYAILTGI